jgi:ParB family chromosome partitioning protein
LTSTTDAPATTPAGTPTYDLELVYRDPRSLLLDRNVRMTTAADAEFVESLRLHGVLQPIVAVRTGMVVVPDKGKSYDQLRVKFGHRRTVGAIEAGLDRVPVLIAGDEQHNDPAQIERLLTQIAENDARAGLTELDRLNAVEQLSLFGMSADEIAAATKTRPDTVAQRLTVARSQTAKAFLMEQPNPGQYLDVAAALAEFDGKPEQAELIELAQGGSWMLRQRIQEVRNKEVEDRLVKAGLEKALELGLRVVPDDEPCVALRSFAVSEPDDPYKTMTGAEHADCPGHGVQVDVFNGDVWLDTRELVHGAGHRVVLAMVNDEVDFEAGDDALDDDEDGDYEIDQDVVTPRPVEDVALPGDELAEKPRQSEWVKYAGGAYVCTQPDLHTIRGGASAATMGGVGQPLDEAAAKEQARAERADVIASNKAWTAAEELRREWLKTAVKMKAVPKGTSQLLMAALVADGFALRDHFGDTYGLTLLGVKKVTYARDELLKRVTAAGKKTEPAGLVEVLTLVLAAYEQATDRNDWRGKPDHTARYLRFLSERMGYQLSDVEKRAAKLAKP